MSQVRRHHAAAVAALVETSRAVAGAQERAITGGDREALRAATAARQAAVAALEAAVDAVLAAEGRSVQHRDEVLHDLEDEVMATVATGTFGIRDDLELPERNRPVPVAADRAAARQAERRAAEASGAMEAAESRVARARAELERAEAELAEVRARYRDGG